MIAKKFRVKKTGALHVFEGWYVFNTQSKWLIISMVQKLDQKYLKKN